MSKGKIKATILGVIVIFLIAIISFLWRTEWQKNNQKPMAKNEAVSVSENADKKENITNTLLAEKNTSEVTKIIENNKDLSSENFIIKQVSFNSDTILNGNDSANLPIEIYNVKSDVFTDGKSGESEVVITWKSNKSTYAEISYAKNNGQKSSVVKEGGYGFSHSVIISNLDQGAGYIYKITSKDRWGNSQTSDYFGIYSGSRAVSIFELVGKAFNEIFGWAINKK